MPFMCGLSQPVKPQRTKPNSTKGEAMRDEYDFTKGERGKFYHPNIKLNLPVYLDDEVQTQLTELAKAKGVELSFLVNALLKKDIELIQMAR